MKSLNSKKVHPHAPEPISLSQRTLCPGVALAFWDRPHSVYGKCITKACFPFTMVPSWILPVGSSLLVKITQARPYHQAWPGWAVLLNGFPNSNTAHQYSICPQFNFMWRDWPSPFDGRHGHMIHSANKCKENWYVSYLDGRISLL